MSSVIENLIKEAKKILLSSGVETFGYELRLLLAEVLKCDVGNLRLYQKKLSNEQQARFFHYIEQRKNHVPADKIIGHRGFYKYDFLVSDKVLSPRSDTEILVEAAAADIRRNNWQNVLELGVGSGCIILSLLADFAELQGVGIDVSADALKIARQNSVRLSVEKRVNFIQADWFAPEFINNFNRQFDLIVSNPPYISTSEISALSPEVKDYDPLFALDGGADGFDSYRKIAQVTPLLLKTGGHIYLEVGEKQADEVVKIFEKKGLMCCKILNDFNGIKRCVILKK